MRFTNSLLLIAIITLSYASAFEFASFAEVSEISADPYGKSLIETISHSLATKGKVDDVKDLLQKLLFELNKDQAEDDAAWKKESARLKAKIARLRREIDALEKEIAALKVKLAKYEALKKQAELNLIQYKKQRAHNVKVLKENDERRKKDAADFKRSQGEHQDVINAINAVVAELKHLVGSVSGAGKPTHVKVNAEEKRDAAHAALKKAFIEISQEEAEINAFVELATEADQAALEKLIALIEKVKKKTIASYNDDKNHEEASILKHKTLKALLESDNRKLDRMIAEETKNLNTYIKIIAETKALIATKEKLLKETRALLAATIKEYKEKEAKYLADKAQRDSERIVIKKLQSIVQKRLANMSKYLTEQSNNA